MFLFNYKLFIISETQNKFNSLSINSRYTLLHMKLKKNENVFREYFLKVKQ